MPGSPIKYVLDREIQAFVDMLVKRAVEENAPKLRDRYLSQGKKAEEAEALVRQFETNVRRRLEQEAIEASKKELGIVSETTVASRSEIGTK